MVRVLDTNGLRGSGQVGREGFKKELTLLMGCFEMYLDRRNDMAVVRGGVMACPSFVPGIHEATPH